MTCRELERWLDDGMPPAQGDAARAHAAECPDCAIAFAAEIEIQSLIETVPVAAPERFTDRVLARVATADSWSRVVPAPALPWWIRVAAQPATVLAAVVAGLLVMGRDPLVGAGRDLFLALAGSAAWQPPALGALDRPDVMLGLSLAAMPVMAWTAWLLYRGCERLVGPSRSVRSTLSIAAKHFS